MVLIGDQPERAHAFFDGLCALLRVARACGRTRKTTRWFDHCDVVQRGESLETVGSWLPDWPSAFLIWAHDHNVTWTQLQSPRSTLPYWVHKVARSELLTKRAPITLQEAVAIRAYMARAHPTIPLRDSRIVCGRGVEPQHLPEYMRFTPSQGTFEALLAHIDARSAKAKSPNLKRRFFTDKVMLVTARFLRLSQVRVCSLTLKDLAIVAEGIGEEAKPGSAPSILSEFRPLIRRYLSETAPAAGDELQRRAAFLTQNGQRALQPSAFGERFRKHLAAARLVERVTDFRALIRH